MIQYFDFFYILHRIIDGRDVRWPNTYKRFCVWVLVIGDQTCDRIAQRANFQDIDILELNTLGQQIVRCFGEFSII